MLKRFAVWLESVETIPGSTSGIERRCSGCVDEGSTRVDEPGSVGEGWGFVLGSESELEGKKLGYPVWSSNPIDRAVLEVGFRKAKVESASSSEKL